MTDDWQRAKQRRARICRVAYGYPSAYPEPFLVQPGDVLTAGDRESEWPGWVWCTNQHGVSRWLPEAYLQRKDDQCIVLRDYEATELTVRAGEEVLAGEAESGWVWCTNKKGRSGWVPANHLLDSAADAT